MVWCRTGGILKMKRIKLFAITAVILSLVSSVAIAQSYLENSHRYVRCPIGMGIVSYIDTASVNVEEYRPPLYIITINKIERNTQDTYNTHLRYGAFKFKYDYAQRKMYIYHPDHGDGMKNRYVSYMKNQNKPIDNTIDWNSEWQYIYPDVYYGSGTSDMAVAGEVAFAIAYNLKFHGEKYHVFQDGFYEKLPNAAKIKNHL